MAITKREYLLGRHIIEEQTDDNGVIIEPGFLLETKILVHTESFPKENKTKINAQLYYHAKCNSEWGRTITLTFNDYRTSAKQPILYLTDLDGHHVYRKDSYGFREKVTYSLTPRVKEVEYTSSMIFDEYKDFYNHLDGTKSFNVKAFATTRVQGLNSFDSSDTILDTNEYTATITLNRKEYPVLAYDFTDEGTPFITYTAPSTGKSNVYYWQSGLQKYAVVDDTVLSMQLSLSFDGVNPDITYRSLPQYGIEYELQLTDAERELLLEKAQGATTVPIYYLLKTVRNAKYEDRANETVEFVSATKRSLTIVDCKPVILPVVRDIDATTVNLTGDSNKFIKNHSLAEYAINATASKGATIVKQSVKCGSKTFTDATGRIANVESGKFVFSATDSRNQTVEVVLDREFVDYIELTCNQKATIELSAETDAVIVMEITGKHFRGSFGAVANNFIVEVRHSENGGELGEWVRISDFVEVYYDGSSYTMDFNISGLRYDASYTIQTRAFDKLNSVITAEYTAKIMPVFDWSGTDFNFNVPVTFMGDTMADIVIEEGTTAMGTNGTWYWRKWQSGRAECYGCRNYGNMGVSTAWGGLYRSEVFSQNLPTGLFVATPDVIDITFRGANFGGWIAKHETYAPGADTSGGFILVRPASATLSQAYISFNVIGRWK